MVFQPPIADILFALDAAAGNAPGSGQSLFDDLPPDTVAAILEEAGKFAASELAPLNRVGDVVGARRNGDGTVTTAPGWREAYRHFRDAGWNGLSAPEAHGGQGLPTALAMAVQEMWNAGSAAFALAPMLTAGAIEALDAHGSDDLKTRYLPRMVSGEWTGTMNLTEPQAGSDLGAIRTRAEPAADGTYRLFGEKIFITYGEHDLAENIIHLVLARIAGAPDGTRGLSLFVVPKRLVGDDGAPGEANDVACARLEEKLGIHGSPTCAMIYGGAGRGATGFLVGEANRGLAGMFTMMNLARLNVGIQGVGVAERARQEALAYARERRQGRAPGIDGPAPIIAHADVSGMLLRMQALVAASRALAYSCAFAFDMSRRADPSQRARWADRASLLTPLAKAFATDAANEVASLGVQVHGGMGYIEETGAAQHLRDARIFAIYEGTNGIQAVDLVLRRLKLDHGAAVARFIDELGEVAVAVRQSNRSDLGATGGMLEAAVDSLRRATAFIADAEASGRGAETLAGATAYLRLFALTASGALLARGALAAPEDRHGSLARYFTETLVAESGALCSTVTGGAAAHRLAAAAWLG
ncbi:MAG: acyl-CoA dehydrogenase [Rhizobiales bacterium]|nr:acyl-CoA dehydrogenase [Hyphomicrobiales bacterium]